MKIGRKVTLAALVAVVLALMLAPSAFARDFPSVWTAGDVRFTQDGTTAHSLFAAAAVGPAAPGEEHQPAKGLLSYRDETGLRFRASIHHIHAHSSNEVHFGGTIVWANDPAQVGRQIHVVAIDNGRTGDMFSLLVTDADVHMHGPPVPVERGGLVVKVG